MKYFLYCLQHYADFNGRARRSEYWFFQLFNFLITIGIYLIVLGIKEVIGINLGFLNTVYSIAVLIPNLAVTARRLHDTNRSGWWQMLSIGTGLITFVLAIIFVLSILSYRMNEYAISICMEQKALLILLILSAISYIAACILLLVWYCFDSQQGVNRFGSSPKEENNANLYQQALNNGGHPNQQGIHLKENKQLKC